MQIVKAECKSGHTKKRFQVASFQDLVWKERNNYSGRYKSSLHKGEKKSKKQKAKKLLH